MPDRIRTADELQRALSVDGFLLFKHSTLCPVSSRAFEEYCGWAEEHPDALTGWIEVVQERVLARAVAESTGVGHESPQALLLVRGTALWHASHGAITRDALGAVVDSRTRG